MTPPFDILGPLPTGTTLLEASAGTGKTYTIAALATRYIALGETTIDQMLLITFGRAATRELRERVRGALTTARERLRDGEPTDDTVISSLQTMPDAQRGLACQRLTQALADFDAATIATTHQFCLIALRGLGITADTDPGETFVENIGDVIDEVVDDFYVRKYAHADGERIPYDEARTLARTAVLDPQSQLYTGAVAPDSLEATRVAFANAVRAEVLRRRRARHLVTFDDLVLRLRDVVTDELSGEQACQRLREAYDLVLVDEFQDTDPAQWTILRTAFHGHRTLILIGDPKQAIYAFRGADIYSYLDAASQADNHATLPTNWRSDLAVVRGVDALMGGLELGNEHIVVHPVTAHHEHSRVNIPGAARVRLRTFHPDEAPAVGVSRDTVARDVARDIVGLLNGAATVSDATSDRRVAPADIAVLVGTHAQAALVRSQLIEAGVPAVVNSSSSVFATEAAAQWVTLLAAMRRPRGALLRDAALTVFFGEQPSRLALYPDQVDAEVATSLRSWSQIAETGSIAQMVAAIELDSDLSTRVLSAPQGERTLTDIRHVASALHTQQRATRAGVVALHDWLSEQIRRAKETGREPTTELTRRLETDAEAVQVLTVHTSKGLEFPVVYVPFGWDRRAPTVDGPIRCHDPDGRRILDVRGPAADNRKALLAARDAEESGESLRLLYVAVTRASSLLVVHWASSKQNTRLAALHRALCAKEHGDRAPKAGYSIEEAPLVDSPWVVTESVDTHGEVMRWSPPGGTTSDLLAARFTREVDPSWRRTSYSGLTRTVHASEHRPAGFRDDEPDGLADESAPGVADNEMQSAFAHLPAGAAFGTLVHAVLEVVDTTSADLEGEVLQRCREQLVQHPLDVPAEQLARAIVPALRTPLGDVADDTALTHFTPSDRLAEMDFELPMGGHRAHTLADLAGLLRRHLSSADPLAAYADRLAADGLGEATLVGYLSGSIDAVLRTPSQRYLVVDYKTNLLRDPAHPGVEALVRGYTPPRLAEAMMDAHYPLQALLYSAALHRYLRWRLPGYDPGRHLGGVLYLFVRGMAGPETPDGCGVFSWRPAPQLVCDISDLLDGRAP